MDVCLTDCECDRMSVGVDIKHAACSRWNKEQGRAPPPPEEDRIDDDLDFEAAKFTITLRHSCCRPVAETNEAKGRKTRIRPVRPSVSLARPSASAAAASCFYLRDE